MMFQPFGALVFQNSAIIKSCTFVDNNVGIRFFRPVPTTKSIIKNNHFSTDEGALVYIYSHRAIAYTNLESLNRIWVANNTFNDISTSFSTTLSYVNNRHIDSQIFNNNSEITSPAYIYNNHLLNSSIIGKSESGSSSNELDSTYIRKNTIENTVPTASEGIELYGYGYFEVSDNVVHGSIEDGLNSTGKVFNNIVHDGNSYTGALSLGFYDFYNNIVMNNRIGLSLNWRTRSAHNNLLINNRFALNGLSDNHENYIKSTVFIGNEKIADSPSTDTLLAKNCILDSMEIDGYEGYFISGENNIFIDSTQINDIFEDFENNNFHLMDGSIAIDAGQDIVDTTGHFYYNSFDLDNFYRIWDGDGDGTATRDIGPYEYNSQSFGTITGQITEETTGDPVDYVLLKVNNNPGVFEFADSLGYYEIKLPAGIYDLYAERVFCEDKVVSNITVIDGEITDIEFEMVSELVVSIEEENNYELIITNYKLKQNYPNPFNPVTKINYELRITDYESAEIVVYNSAGQEVWSKNLSTDHSSPITNYCTFDGSQFNSGIYFYSLIVDGKTVSTKSMVMIK